MRYKKQIVIICLITFLFLPFQKFEEPKAEILTLTTGVIIACAALATACGLVITNQDMIQDVGSRVYDGIKNIPNAIENVGDNIKINVTKDILNTVIDVCNAIPKVDYWTKRIFQFLDGSIYRSWTTHGYADNVRVGSVTIVPYLGDSSSYDYITLEFDYGGNIFGRANYPLGESINIEFDMSTQNGIFNINGQEYTRFSSYSSWGSYGLSISPPSNFYGSFRVVGYESYESICIPYIEKNSENVSVDKPKEYFPVGSGSISVPIDTPLSNYNPSVDNPISLPSDLVGDGISADVNTSTDTGVIDKPNVDVGETPTTGEGLWDTLLSWLSSLFAPLVSLLEWIGSILTSILDFLLGLLEKLKDLLIYLFVPSEGILVDALNGWRADLESKFGLDFSVIDGLQNVDEQGVKDIEFTIMGVDVVLPLSFVNKFASTSRTFTTGLVVIFLVWYQYRNAYKLLRNSEPLQGDGGGKK